MSKAKITVSGKKSSLFIDKEIAVFQPETAM
jgi:hypothetical protein